MKNELREFARDIREHLKTANHALELTKRLDRLAVDAFEISNMPDWNPPDQAAQKGLRSLSMPGIKPPADIDMPLPPKKK